MIIPESCVKWLNLQRTGYKKPIKEFIANIRKEYMLMIEYLPEKCETILDIGCGIGGIDVLLFKHYDNPKLFLMDNSRVTEKRHYGYCGMGACYNSFDATADMLKANFIQNYKFLDINENHYPEIGKVDLIISLLSCGYHYPVDEYLEYINKTLAENGTLIIDCRENTNGIETLKKYFKDIKFISCYNKSDRICARRKK